MRQRSRAAELLDVHASADAVLAGNLRDLARINLWTGGLWLLLRALAYLLDGEEQRPFTLLDVGGGAGDTVAAIQRWSYRRGGRCDGIVIDHAAPVLCLAGRRSPQRIGLVRGRGEVLPLADRSVDVATCSLVLHHCSDEGATRVLTEMGRVARIGVVVDDLIRSRLGYVGAIALAHFATANPLTRHDAPLSVQRAFTERELAALLAQTGLVPMWKKTLPGYRVVMAARKSGTYSGRIASLAQSAIAPTNTDHW